MKVIPLLCVFVLGMGVETGTCHVDGKNCDSVQEADAIEKLFQWAREGGAKFNKLDFDGRTAVAKEDMDGDEYLLYIPRNLFICVDDDKLATHKYQQVSRLFEPGSRWLKVVLLTMRLLEEKFLGSKSFHKYHIATIPKSFAFHPLMWSEQELTFTGLLPGLSKALRDKDQLAQIYEELQQAGIPQLFFGSNQQFFTVEMFYWAYLAAATRNFNTLDVNAMIPLADMLNHEMPEHNTQAVEVPCIKGRPEMCYSMSTTKPVKVGQELTISYGEGSNSELFWRYGFVLDNPGSDQQEMYFDHKSEDSSIIHAAWAQLDEEKPDWKAGMLQTGANCSVVLQHLMRMARLMVLHDKEAELMPSLVWWWDTYSPQPSVDNSSNAADSQAKSDVDNRAIRFLFNSLAGYHRQLQELDGQLQAGEFSDILSPAKEQMVATYSKNFVALVGTVQRCLRERYLSFLPY